MPLFKNKIQNNCIQVLTLNLRTPMFVEVKTKSPNDMAQLLTLFQESDQDLLDRYRRMAVATDNVKVVDLIDDFILTRNSK